MHPANQNSRSKSVTPKNELQLFLFLTMVLIPGISVAGIAAYGFFVWIYQMFSGPPAI